MSTTMEQIREAIDAERAELEGRIAALDAAAEALFGPNENGQPEPPAAEEEMPKPRRKRGPYMSYEQRKRQVLDLIRARGDRAAVAAKDLVKGGVPRSSAQVVIDGLIAEGKLARVGTTSRGAPVVRYRPIRIVPGEEVVA